MSFLVPYQLSQFIYTALELPAPLLQWLLRLWRISSCSSSGRPLIGFTCRIPGGSPKNPGLRNIVQNNQWACVDIAMGILGCKVQDPLVAKVVAALELEWC